MTVLPLPDPPTLDVTASAPGNRFPGGTDILITGRADSKGVLLGPDPGPITFESIPGGTATDGMAVDTQFAETHGVSFALEGGGSPVLAKVGSPGTAFQGYESREDEPAPGQHTDRFSLQTTELLADLLNLSSSRIAVRWRRPAA